MTDQAVERRKIAAQPKPWVDTGSPVKGRKKIALRHHDFSRPSEALSLPAKATAYSVGCSLSLPRRSAFWTCNHYGTSDLWISRQNHISKSPV